MNKIGTLTLETKRLILRKCEMNDYKDAYVHCYSDIELCELQGFKVHDNDSKTKLMFEDKISKYESNKFYNWAIIEKSSNQYIGEISLSMFNEEYNSMQIGYHLGKEFRKKGYMSEAFNKIIHFGFIDLDLNQIYALILPQNISSQKVVTNNGFVFSRTIDNYKDDVNSGNINKYKLTKKDYIINQVKQEIINRSNKFQEETKGTKDEYNLWLEHVQYVYKYAVMIAEKKNVDKEVVELSALLHDIAMTDRSLDRSKHNEYGSEIAEKLLIEYGLDKEKIQLVKKCILNHSSKRKEYRTTEEENILVNADAMAHFDCIDSLYSLATKVMGLNEEESKQFVKDKLTRDYLEIDEDIRNLVKEKYDNEMKK